MNDDDDTITADGILRAGADAIADRAAERDVEAERSMARTVACFNAMTGHRVSEVDGWQFLELLKMARSRGGRHRLDDYVDGAAYAALAGEAAEAAYQHAERARARLARLREQYAEKAVKPSGPCEHRIRRVVSGEPVQCMACGEELDKTLGREYVFASGLAAPLELEPDERRYTVRGPACPKSDNGNHIRARNSSFNFDYCAACDAVLAPLRVEPPSDVEGGDS